MSKRLLLPLVLPCLLAPVSSADITVEMVLVGNPGNGPDAGNTSEPFHGGVDHEYSIAKYETTNAQYAALLNAVAATDTNGLYNASMGSDPRGGIARSGASGSYTYEVRANMGDKPVNFVGWYDAVRFCNWLHNGQPGGAQDSTTTEDGAYTLTGPSSIRAGTDPDHGVDGRNAGAKYHLPGDDEWYKAAYHQPASQGGDADDYWLYPTASNSAPTIATADATGNVNNDTENIANYERGADWNDQDGNLTTVGSGGPGSASYYGAFDMGGNASEWYELMTLPFLGYRGQRGGSALHLTGPSSMQSLYRIFDDPTRDLSNSTGFRVAGVPAVLEAPFAITEIDLSADRNTVTLTWTSTPGQSYTVKVTTDLTNWDTGLDASVEASEGDTTSEVFSIGGRVSDDGGIFFRVEIK